jgi:hypothetical protein
MKIRLNYRLPITSLYGTMINRMLRRSCKQVQIFRPVIRAYFIDVVNRFRRFQRSAQELFGNSPMLRFLTLHEIAIGAKVISYLFLSILPSTTFSRADAGTIENGPSCSSKEFFSALFAFSKGRILTIGRNTARIGAIFHDYFTFSSNKFFRTNLTDPFRSMGIPKGIHARTIAVKIFSLIRSNTPKIYASFFFALSARANFTADILRCFVTRNGAKHRSLFSIEPPLHRVILPAMLTA